jgi:hypothetical protein
MRKTALQLCILILSVFACYGPLSGGVIMPLETRSASPLPEAHPTTCAPLEQIVQSTAGEIKIHFYCGITNEQSTLITDFVRLALDGTPPGVVMSADVYVLDDLEQAATTKFGWLLLHGYPESYRQILEQIGSDCGEAEQGALFFYLTKQCWSDESAYPNEELILHEMHHLLQAELSGSTPRNFPTWLEEGGADAFAYRQLDVLAGSRSRAAAPSIPCIFRLADLENRRHDETDACVYWEGQHAVEWLLQSFGTEQYYELFRRSSSGQAFSDIFLDTYGIRLGQFYPIFDQYRKLDYKTMPIPPAVVGTGTP